MEKKEIVWNISVKICNKNDETEVNVNDSTEIDESQMMVKISIEEHNHYESKESDPYPSLYGCDEMLYTDDDYAYYSTREDVANGNVYYSLFRFNKKQFMSAVKYALYKSPVGLIDHLETLDGFEMIEDEKWE